jgi:hypothetical protein
MFFLMLVIIGIVTIFGVLIIGAIEVGRMQKGRQDIISDILEKRGSKAEK